MPSEMVKGALSLLIKKSYYCSPVSPGSTTPPQRATGEGADMVPEDYGANKESDRLTGLHLELEENQYIGAFID